MTTLASRARLALALLAATPVVLRAADALARPVSSPSDASNDAPSRSFSILSRAAGAVDWLWDHPLISVPTLLILGGLLWVADRQETARRVLINVLGIGLLVCLLVLGSHLGHVLALSVPVWLSSFLLRGLHRVRWTSDDVLGALVLLGGVTVVVAMSLLFGGYVVPVMMVTVALLVIGFVMAQKSKRRSWSTATVVASPAPVQGPAAPSPQDRGRAAEPAGRPPLVQRPGAPSPQPDPVAMERAKPLPSPPLSRYQQLDRAFDGVPFSLVLLEELVVRLYTEVQRARGGALGSLAPYVTESTREALGARPVSEVRDVAVGSVRLVSVQRPPDGALFAQVEIEASLTEIAADATAQDMTVTEVWTLARNLDIPESLPDVSKPLGCPCCGAPLAQIVDGVCAACQQAVGPGQYQWGVGSIAVTRRDLRGPDLTVPAIEPGNDLRTVIDDHLNQRWTELLARHPSADIASLQARCATILAPLQQAWTQRDPDLARDVVSPAVTSSLSFWSAAHRRAGRHNHLEQGSVVRIEPARIDLDPWFDSFTLRVWIRSLDYVVDDAGTVTSGSRELPRDFSEYWTLSRPTPSPDEPASPTSDWRLSHIEQDEAYA